jgi:16S rRNA (guanine(966)-N(2))-methyltransferase RsmD
MRISGGDQRGRRLQSPKGSRTRPTSALLRQAVLNVLAARIPGARLLDLFAGTGAVGVEALSRGAAHVTFVERDPRALASLRQNLASLGLGERATVVGGDVEASLRHLGQAGARFEAVFIDPPYASDLAGRCIEVLAPGDLLSENALLIVQAFHKTVLPEHAGLLHRRWRRRYGESSLSLYARESPCS